MEFKNAISILFSNVGYIFKVLLYLLIAVAIAGAVGFAIIYPTTIALKDCAEFMRIVGQIKDSLANVWDGSHNLRYAANALIPNAAALIREIFSHPTAAVGIVFGLILGYGVYTLLTDISSYALADIINKLMTSNLRFGFASAIVLNFKRAFKFAICKLPISLFVDLVGALIVACALFGLFSVMGVFSAPILLFIGVAVCSLRALLFCGWLPRYLYHENERPLSSLYRSFPTVKRNLSDMFKCFALIYSCAYVTVSVLMMPTGGLAPLIIVPICYFLVRAGELIGYFKTKGFSFYCDGTNVVNTIEYGFRRDNQFEPSPRSDKEDDDRA